MANVNDIFSQYEQKQSKVSQGYGNFRVDKTSGQQTQTKTNTKSKRDLLDTLMSIGFGTAGAIGGSFVTPIAGTIAGGALGGGLAESLSQLRHGENDTGALVRETALGGLFSAPIGKVARGGFQVAKGVGKEVVEQGAKEVGEAAVRNAASSTIKNASERSAITNFGEGVARRSTGIIGGVKSGASEISVKNADEAYRLLRNNKVINPARSAEANLGRTEDFISGLWKPLQTTVGNTPINARSISDKVLEKVGKTSPSLIENKKFVDTIVDMEKTVKTSSDLQRFITQNVDDLISFSRSDAARMPDVERAAKIIREVALDALPGASREVKKKLSTAYTARGLLQKASGAMGNADRAGLMNTLTGTIRQAKGAVGEGIQRVGQAGEILGARNLPYATKGYGAIGRQMLADGTSVAMDPTNMQQQDPTMMQDPMMEQGMTDEMGQTMPGDQQMDMPAMNDPYAEIRQGLQAAMLEDLQTTGGKRVGAIKNVLDSLPDAPGLDANAKKNVAKFSGANAVLDQLEQSFNRSGGGRGTAGGLLGQLTSMSADLDPGGNVYQGQRQAFLTQIIRAMGEVGTLTDKDREVIAGAIPQLTDTPQTAQIKIQDLRGLLGELQNRNAGYGDTSLQDVLYGGNLGIR